MKHDISDQIISFLIKDKLLTDKQVEHATKVKSKIVSSKRILDVIKELKYITDDQIKQSLTQHKHTFRIGDLLIEFGYLTKEKLEAALEIKEAERNSEKREKRKLGEILIDQKFITEDDFLDLLSVQLGFPHIDFV